jgi:virginiamycin B lyase
VYYSDYARGYLGRLDPKTGKVEEWPSPGGRSSQPYGIAATADGIIWYSESNVQPNTIVRFDPKTNEFQIAPVPSGGGVLRHIDVSKDGKDLFIASSGVNKVGIVKVNR